MPCQPADLARNGALLIQATSDDGGMRPFPAGDNAAFWTNPNLFLTGGMDPTTARIGAAHGVHVTVKNTCNVPLSNITVETWISNFGLGAGPATALASSNPGGAPMIGFFSGPLNPGATQTITMESDWTPLASDNLSNGGWVSMAANAYGNPPDKGQPLGADGKRLNLFCDQHHGVRSCVIFRGVGGYSFSLPVSHPNLAAISSAEIDLEIRFISGAEAAHGLREMIGFREDVVVASLAPPLLQRPRGVIFYVPAFLRILPRSGQIPADAAIAYAETPSDLRFFLQNQPETSHTVYLPMRISDTSPADYRIASQGVSGGRTLTLKLEPGATEMVEVDLDGAVGHLRGDILVFDLLQRRSDGQAIGGARVAVIVDSGGL
jgi:hypothetical protein